MSLLVVGALHWDVVVTADRLPRIDETLRGRTVEYRLGGKGGNQALAARRAGARVTFAGRVGADEPGRAMRATLAANGVDVSRLQQGSGASGMSAAITVADGGYGAVIVAGENAQIDPHAITVPEGCRIVLMQNETPPNLLNEMADKVRSKGAELWLNAAPATGLGKPDLRLAQVVIVNRVEGADLVGRDPGSLSPVALVSALQSLVGDATIVLTLGGDGVAFASPGAAVETFPARRVDVVSTHGAGDVFVGTLAAARLDGRRFPDAIATAQGAAARHVSQIR